MNKKQIIASLNNIANELDLNNLYKEANIITKVMTKLAAPSDFTGNFTGDSLGDPRTRDFRNLNGKMIINEVSKLIMSVLKDNEKAQEDFSGGELQSFVTSILDLSIDDYQEAIKEMQKMFNSYNSFGFDDSASKLFNIQINNWKNYKSKQKEEMGL